MRLLSLKRLSKICSIKPRFQAESEGGDGVLISASVRTVLGVTYPLVGVSVRRVLPQRPCGLLPSSLRQARSPNEFHLNFPQKYVEIRVLTFVQFEVLPLILFGVKRKSFNTLRTGVADLRFYITTGQDGWRKSAFLTRAYFPCTIHLIMQYTEPVSEWSCWRMFIETWPHSELTFRHRTSSI